ncbi:MAG TPA: hypothetical protein VL101_09235 [Nordella sp.]|nr:hypothetical protein [Nordella sp.]
MRILSTTLLAALLLNAGAFTSDNRAYLRANATHEANVTVLTKNQAWPAKSQMRLEPCSLAGCIGV